MAHVTDTSNTENHFQTLMEQGIRQFHAHQYTEAVETFESLEKINPSASEVHFHKGNAYFQLERYDLARSCFEQAITLDPMEGTAYINLGKMLFKQEQFALAAYYWELSKTLVKNNPNLWLNLGIAYDKLYQPDRAMNAYSLYMGLQGTTVEAAKLQVRFEKGRKVFENNILIADEMLKRGDLVKAGDIFRKELMAYPGTAKVYKTYASLLYQTGALKNALTYYLKAFDARPGDSGQQDGVVLINLGVIYEKLERPIDALWAYTSILNGKLPDAEKVTPHQKRVLAMVQGKAESLIPSYIQSIRDQLKHPMQAEEGRRMAEHIETLKNLFPAQSADIHEAWETAQEVFSPALKAAKTYFVHAEDARNSGKFDQALQFYQKYLILQSKGDKANQARQYIQEIKQMMGAVVTAMLQSGKAS